MGPESTAQPAAVWQQLLYAGWRLSECDGEWQSHELRSILPAYYLCRFTCVWCFGWWSSLPWWLLVCDFVRRCPVEQHCRWPFQQSICCPIIQQRDLHFSCRKCLRLWHVRWQRQHRFLECFV